MAQELGIKTGKQQDPHSWYSEVVKKADMAEHSDVQGCMIIKPWGMRIWELIKEEFDSMIKETGVDNGYFPLFITESFLEKENEIIEGFDPEVAWVTHGGDDELEEKLAVRPTSELPIADRMSEWIRSHRDLPFRINQWSNVVRWEASDTRPFLRTREFLWQEGHTAHRNNEKADEEVMLRLGQYEELVEETLAIPSILGYKPEHDKFPGAEYTTTIETLMPTGKSIQSGTSHNLGTHFADAFEIEFTDKNEEKQTCHTTSWGASTRLIGALIMAHGDDDGLRLPPKLAPKQVVVVPIHQEENKEKVHSYVDGLEEELGAEFRVEVDDDETKSPGFKFNHWELKGVPVRIEIGPNEVEDETVTLVRRDSGEKEMGIAREDVAEKLSELMEDIQSSMYNDLEEYLHENIREAESKNEILATIGKSRGYVKTRWCGKESCEAEIKDQVAAEIVALPFSEGSKPAGIRETDDEIEGECSICREDAKTWAYFAKNY